MSAIQIETGQISLIFKNAEFDPRGGVNFFIRVGDWDQALLRHCQKFLSFLIMMPPFRGCT